MATPMTVNFANVEEIRQHMSGNPRDILKQKPVPVGPDGRVLTPKQIRARIRRRHKKMQIASAQELEYLYKKPVDEWDLQELAHGRPRNAKGHFAGPNPGWVTAEIHEEAMAKYKAAVKTNMQATTVDALGLLTELIQDKSTDQRGKPIVPASTKLDAAKFLIEHVIGKPTQRIESDVSVKLQGILGQVMVMPGQNPDQNYQPSHYPGLTMPLLNEGEYDDSDDDLDSDIAG